ncbi:MFS transporter [Kitasatospora kifunensis]|uniref:Putative MFS family arabinose efflux permease n=1 Tax=Kitasatospora kifunensis TaxID=58351 RepID=A0A7W7VT63_KITKI|nr:MFS transporter [Kitasatospora kifunensis]MBB4921448.1 putative MFS family arabinose efflux permease [Kitasatospora kifunensis]
MTTALETTPRAAVDSGLRTNRAFRLLWIGESGSKVGTAITGVALPLLATVTLHAGAFEIGLITAVQWVPWLLVGLPAGVWADRYSPRRLMIWCNVGSAVALLSVPLAAAVHALTVTQIMLVAALLGLANVFFSTAYLVYLPLIVPPQDLVAANSRLQGSESTAQIAGPGLGGALAQLLGAAVGPLVNAGSFAASTLCLLLAPEPEAVPRSGPAASLRREIGEGLRYVGQHRVLRLLTVVAALANLTMTAYEAILVVFLVRTVQLPPAAVGLLMAATGLGGIAGVLAAAPLARRLGEPRAIVYSLAATAPFGLLLPLTGPGLGMVCFVLGAVVPVAGLVVYNVVVSSFRQRHAPRHLLGRISATMRFLMFGAIPLGALAGGTLGSLLGLRSALWCIMAAALLPALLLGCSPLRRQRELHVAAAPEQPEVCSAAEESTPYPSQARESQS